MFAAWLVGAASMGLANVAASAPATLRDGTIADHWELPNRLRVTTRHIPKAQAIVITIAYRIGSAEDPSGSEGLADLLAEIAFTGATDEVPERTRQELDTLRPLGWTIASNPTLTLLTEVCRPNQLPGVLHQVASRMAGVHVTSKLMRASVATVKTDLATRYVDQIDQALHHMLRAAAAGRDPKTVARYATGKGLEGITLAQLREWLANRYVPANAVLAIAGDLSGLDLRRFIENEFGGIPAGTRAGAVSRLNFKPRSLRWPHAKARADFPAIAVRAPALTDSAHPAFYLSTLIIGGYSANAWGPPTAPRTSNYRYAVLDDPELVRFYPPVTSQGTAGETLTNTAGVMTPDGLPEETYDATRQTVGWLLGAALPPQLAPLAKTDLALLLDLTTSMASRPHFGDQGFWAKYRQRLENVGAHDFLEWRTYMLSAQNRIELTLTPRR